MTYFTEYGSEYLHLLLEHVEISGLVVVISVALAVPLGILCSKQQCMETLAEHLAGALRIVPSLAVLIVSIPILGTGWKPAVLSLVLLAIPPILLNTVQGFRQLAPEVLEAADAMGMSRTRKFFRVELPLAFPLLCTGIRTASVEVIASATLAAYIGAGGLGSLIFTGLGLMRVDLLYIGGISVACLSLLAGFALDKLYRYGTKYQQNK